MGLETRRVHLQANHKGATMIPHHGARVDMHCHSTASAVAKLGIARSVGLPECATPPEEVYELAKRRGMDFVTITDHDTIDGCLKIADRPDVFVSEELTAWFKGEPQAVHVLCYGIDAADHEFLQSHAADLEVCAAHLHEHGIACALAHPFFEVAAPLEPRHRRRLAQLFPVWEVRNGSRARELNMPAAVYIETHGGTGIGGSDDHAGVDIGRTWTDTPPASSPEEFLAHIREGSAASAGDQGSAAKWAHAALALATRELLWEGTDLPHEPCNPAAMIEVAQRVVTDGAARGGDDVAGLGAKEVTAILRTWLDSVSLPSDPHLLIELLQNDAFSHSDLYRRARRSHERKLHDAVGQIERVAERGTRYGEAAASVFEAMVPALPYVPSMAILGAEKRKLARRDGEPRRVALVVDAIGSMHGVSHTVERLREHGVPGYDVEVIGTDPRVDRRLPAVADVDVPHYKGLGIGIPSIPELAETLADGAYDAIHVTAPGPAGVAAALMARIAGIPLVASHHTELASYAGLRSNDADLEVGVRTALALFYGASELVLSPSAAADESIGSLGIQAEKVRRWERGVDLSLFSREKAQRNAYPGKFKVLYAGRLSKEKGVDLLADAFEIARERDPRLHLLLAGGGPEEDWLSERLGEAATFLGWLGREELAQAYASSDLFVFCSQTDTYGQVITEAQASGLPVLAVEEGGPRSLIRSGDTGWLVSADAWSVAGGIAQLAASPYLRDHLRRNALRRVKGRGWDACFAQLAGCYNDALASSAAAAGGLAGGDAPLTPPSPVLRAA